MSLWFLVYVSPLYVLLWSVKIKHGITYGGRGLTGMPPYVRSVSICYHWVGIQRIHFDILNQIWSSGFTKQHFKRIYMSVRVQRPIIWKTRSEPRSVPLNPTALMCHIVAPFSTLIPTLSLSPMEVIKRALFMFDHSTSESWALRPPRLICDSSAGQWRWLRLAWDTQNSLWGLLCNTNQNNDDTRAEAERDALHGQSCCKGI